VINISRCQTQLLWQSSGYSTPGANPNPSTVRALVVDDHDSFRRFVRSTLGRRPGLQVIGEASDGLEAVQKAEELKPDLILLDVGLPTLNGIEACHRMSRVVPDSKILFLTQNNDADLARAALGNGARGYVLKVDAYRELLPAVEPVLRGEQFLSTGIKRHDGKGMGGLLVSTPRCRGGPSSEKNHSRSKDPPQAEKHTLMSRCSDRSSERHGAKYRVYNQGRSDISGNLRPEGRREHFTHFEKSVEVKPFPE
jgi:CheY-like chemotaxis protein